MNFNTAELISPVWSSNTIPWSGVKIMQCSKICEHLTKALTESKTTKQLQHDNHGPLTLGWSHSQAAFFAPRCGQLPIPFSFKCAGIVHGALI